jgi:L-lactate dehydrogenase complex protein LldG
MTAALQHSLRLSRQHHKMKSSAKQNILKKIKQALEKPVPLPFQEEENKNIFEASSDLELLFAENFSALQGRFSFCSNEHELVEQLQALLATREWSNVYVNEQGLKQKLFNQGLKINTEISLADCNASITTCECLVARTGSIVLSSIQSGRTASVYAPVHICIAYADQLIFDIKDGIELIKQKYPLALPSLITFASGPSRTADIEKTLVTGVHGPKEVFCFLVQP